MLTLFVPSPAFLWRFWSDDDTDPPPPPPSPSPPDTPSLPPLTPTFSLPGPPPPPKKYILRLLGAVGNVKKNQKQLKKGQQVDFQRRQQS